MKLSRIPGVDPNIERQIRESVTEALKLGWQLSQGVTLLKGQKEQLCCPLGAVGVAKYAAEYQAGMVFEIEPYWVYGESIGLTRGQCDAFARGFDSGERVLPGTVSATPYKMLGYRIWNDFRNKKTPKQAKAK